MESSVTERCPWCDSLVSRVAIAIALDCHRIANPQCPVACAGQTFTLGSVLGMLLEQAVALCARLITRLEQLGMFSQKRSPLSRQGVPLALHAVP